jgi:hypothetical protein
MQHRYSSRLMARANICWCRWFRPEQSTALQQQQLHTWAERHGGSPVVLAHAFADGGNAVDGLGNNLQDGQAHMQTPISSHLQLQLPNLAVTPYAYCCSALLNAAQQTNAQYTGWLQRTWMLLSLLMSFLGPCPQLNTANTSNRDNSPA